MAKNGVEYLAKHPGWRTLSRAEKRNLGQPKNAVVLSIATDGTIMATFTGPNRAVIEKHFETNTIPTAFSFVEVPDNPETFAADVLRVMQETNVGAEVTWHPDKARQYADFAYRT